MQDVEYYIDGRNFKEFGVYISSSIGLVGMLKRKESLSVDWDNYHGISVDRRKVMYKERTITLQCFIETSGKSNFINKVNSFMAQFDKAGSVRLKVEYDGTEKPLVYEVYCPDDVDVSKKWDDDLMVGTFKLKLIEYEPVKRVLRYTGSQVQINVTSSKLLNIYWGDGSSSFDVTTGTISHTYASSGTYEIVITGVIEDITNFSTNATVIWNRLL